MRTSCAGVISGPWSSRSRPLAAPSSVKGALGGMGLYQGGGGTSVRAGLVAEVLVVAPEAAARVEVGVAPVLAGVDVVDALLAGGEAGEALLLVFVGAAPARLRSVEARVRRKSCAERRVRALAARRRSMGSSESRSSLRVATALDMAAWNCCSRRRSRAKRSASMRSW